MFRLSFVKWAHVSCGFKDLIIWCCQLCMLSANMLLDLFSTYKCIKWMDKPLAEGRLFHWLWSLSAGRLWAMHVNPLTGRINPSNKLKKKKKILTQPHLGLFFPVHWSCLWFISSISAALLCNSPGLFEGVCFCPTWMILQVHVLNEQDT